MTELAFRSRSPAVLATPQSLSTFGFASEGGLILSGNILYGTGRAVPSITAEGCVYSVPLSGGIPTIVASFNGSNGADPYAGVTLSGNTLYGTTSERGAGSYGTVFSVSLPQPAITISTGQTYHFPSVNSGALTVTSVAGLGVQAGGIAIADTAATHASRQLLSIASPGLVIAGSAGNWTGLLDLTNDDMDIAGGTLSAVGSALSAVTSEIAQGYAAGNWNGSGGIESSAAAGDTTHLTTLGVIQNAQPNSVVFTASHPFDGVTPGIHDILVKFTYYGDANLDAAVDGSDYTLIDAGYLAHATGWYNGDFNYDGIVDGSDYTLIDNAFNNQAATLAAQLGSTAGTTSEIATAADAAVPEPAGAALLVIAGMRLLHRRRRITI